MIRKMRALLVMSALLLVLGVGSAVADTYFIYNDFGGTWIDANKTWHDDSEMCWAAAISNVLEYGAWGVAAYPTAPDIFAQFKAAWPNIGGLPRAGFYWWLNGFGLPPSGAPPGGNFWPAYNAITMSDGIFESPSIIESYLRSGYLVTLGISSASGGHALTCWGVEYLRLPSSEPGSEHRGYTSIFVTDSDDDVTALLQIHIGLNASGRWELGDRFSGWELVSAEAFAMRPVMDLDLRHSRSFVHLDPLHELKEVFKLHPFLSFDYRWDGPFPQEDLPGRGHFTIKALMDNGLWVLLFEDYYDPQEEGVWTAWNLPIPPELLGLRTLLFEMEGSGQVSLYRLDYVPLPPSLWLLASGLVGLLAWRRLPS